MTAWSYFGWFVPWEIFAVLSRNALVKVYETPVILKTNMKERYEWKILIYKLYACSMEKHSLSAQQDFFNMHDSEQDFSCF